MPGDDGASAMDACGRHAFPALSCAAKGTGFKCNIPTTLIPDIVTGPNCANSAQTLLSVTISKGKAKNVLAIEGTMSHAVSTSGTPWQKANRGITVNGFLDVVATKYSRSSFCVPNSEGFKDCEFTTTWWVDLDAAEAGAPRPVQGPAARGYPFGLH